MVVIGASVDVTGVGTMVEVGIVGAADVVISVEGTTVVIIGIPDMVIILVDGKAGVIDASVDIGIVVMVDIGEADVVKALEEVDNGLREVVAGKGPA